MLWQNKRNRKKINKEDVEKKINKEDMEKKIRKGGENVLALCMAFLVIFQNLVVPVMSELGFGDDQSFFAGSDGNALLARSLTTTGGYGGTPPYHAAHRGRKHPRHQSGTVATHHLCIVVLHPPEAAAVEEGAEDTIITRRHPGAGAEAPEDIAILALHLSQPLRPLEAAVETPEDIAILALHWCRHHHPEAAVEEPEDIAILALRWCLSHHSEEAEEDIIILTPPLVSTPPSRGSGGSTGGYSYRRPPLVPTPPSRGGGGSIGGYSYPSPPSFGGAAGGILTPPTPIVIFPPTTPIGGTTPTTPPYYPITGPFPGTCNFWRTHPAIIFGLLRWFGTIGAAFGVTSLPGLPSNLSLLQSLSNTRDNGLGQLYREGTASLLNSMVSHEFPYTTQQVKDHFVKSLGFNSAAAAQARLFKVANGGSF